MNRPDIGAKLVGVVAAGARPIGDRLAWIEHEDGGVTEVTAVAGKVARLNDIGASFVAKHASTARSSLLPERIAARLPVVGGPVTATLNEVLAGVRATPLWTRLWPSGAQRRALALAEGGVLAVAIDNDGQVLSIAGQEGFAAIRLLDREDRGRQALVDKHASPVSVETFGDAYLHARSAGSSVVAVRRDSDDAHRILVVCETPQIPEPGWYPQFLPAVATAEKHRRFTRSYQVADPDRVDPADLSKHGLPSYLLVLVASTLLTHKDRLSMADKRLFWAVCSVLVDRVPPGEALVPLQGKGAVEAAVQRRLPELWTRNALMGHLIGAEHG